MSMSYTIKERAFDIFVSFLSHWDADKFPTQAEYERLARNAFMGAAVFEKIERERETEQEVLSRLQNQ